MGEDLFEAGRRAIAEKLYPRARVLLRKAIAKGLHTPDALAEAHYYYALSMLAGTRPSRMTGDVDLTVKKAEEQLCRAVELNPGCRHAYALWAAVKNDCHADHRDQPPSASELCALGSGMDPEHAPEIAPFLDSASGAVWRAVLEDAVKTAAQRHASAPKYFVPDPPPPPFLSLYGAVLVASALLLFALTTAVGGPDVGGFAATAVSTLAGLPVLLIGMVGRSQRLETYRRQRDAAQPKPSDAQMDRWLAGDRFMIMDRALRTLTRSLDELVTEPHVVMGPADGTRHATGQDLVTRFSLYKTVVVMLTRRRLSIYTCVWDFARCRIVSSETFDCRYSDVTGLATRQLGGSALAVRTHTGRSVRSPFARVFEIVIAGTDRIAVVFEAVIPHGSNSLPPSGAAAAERLIRARLAQHA